jgi:hypothetical protein
MRRALTLLGARGTVALVLVVVVVAVVSLARLVGGATPTSSRVQPEAISSGRSEVTPGPSTSALTDDGVSTTATPTPKASPIARKVASAFLKAWLRSDLEPEAWMAGLTPHMTDALAAKLAGVDPAGVPARRTTGTARAVAQGAGLVEVTFPVDSGLVRLRVLRVEGGWLVDGVDWERA